MNKEEYAEAVKAKLTELKPEYKYTITETLKNNGVSLIGITAGPEGSKCRPTVHINDAFAAGRPVDETAEQVLKIAETNQMEDLDINAILNADYVRANVYPCVINKAANKELLKKAVTDDYLDMAVVYKLPIQNGLDGSRGEILIFNERLASMGVTEDEVKNYAMKNAAEKHPALVMPIFDVMSAMGYPSEGLSTEMPMFIVTNEYTKAGVIAYSDVFKDFADMVGQDIWIFPCSTEELIITPKGAVDESLLQMTVHSANETLSPELFLSENTYCYSRDRGEITIVA